MSTLLVKHAQVLATMDDQRREIADGGLFIEDGFIKQVGPTAELPDTADEVLDLTGHLILPGFINTHHHFYQTLTRAVPGAQDAGLFDWLRTLYPIWARMTAEHIEVSTKLALAELALSGCTTAFDHLYLFPNDSRLDDEIEAAKDVGLRLHASRGSMSLGESDGGLPPDSVVETDSEILADTQRLIETHHDGSPGSMTQVVVAPCSPFSVTTDIMRDSAELARAFGVSMHTHLAETMDEEEFCISTYGRRPIELMEDLNWMGDDVWFAHSVFINDAEIGRMANTRTGVAHCPSSNMRLASGIAPVRKYLAANVPTGLGVDGSASNDGSHLLGEARMAMLLSRLDAAPNQSGGELMKARTAIEIATRGGAEVINRPDVGSLESGKAADFIAVDLNRIEYAGALHDPVAAAMLCAPVNVDFNYVAGRAVVANRNLVTLELPPLIERHNRLAGQLLND
ncbi:MAG: 8-oxoguanine deaminase [bacterium]|nr:8-oxoguanine deaminase [bacterium]MCP4964252.1 8-oxoguanine deaminase [bacterium]